MDSWLCITSEENWKAAKSKRVWGLAEKDRKKLERVKVDDSLVFYIKQRIENDETIGPQIKGIFKVASEAFFSEERIFTSSPDEIFPWRIRIEPVAIPKKSLDFKKLVPKLQFIKNKKKWFLYLQVAMRTIPKEDFDLTKSAIMR